MCQGQSKIVTGNYLSDSPEKTFEIALSLAQKCAPGDVIILDGHLGAGKTIFSQGLASGLGVDCPVVSPSFSLVNIYDLPQDSTASRRGINYFVHMDVYRLIVDPNPGDNNQNINGILASLDVDVTIDQAVTVIEWGEKIANFYTNTPIIVRFNDVGESKNILETKEIHNTNREICIEKLNIGRKDCA